MKRILVFLFLIVAASTSYAQSASAIVGKWLNEEKDGQIEIYENKGKYFGKINWMKEPYEKDGKTLRKDSKNPDASQRGRALLNTVILTDFEYSDGKWKGGEIYDPKSGKTYSCEMKLNEGKLEVRGYIGAPMFGRTAYFTGVK